MDEDALSSQINPTPLVDVMLVLLIIFLITVPVAIHGVPVELPRERNVPMQTRPENIVIALDRDGNLFWNNRPLSAAELPARLAQAARSPSRPEVHIRGDRRVRYEAVGRVVAECQQAGIFRVGFITDPRP